MGKCFMEARRAGRRSMAAVVMGMCVVGFCFSAGYAQTSDDGPFVKNNSNALLFTFGGLSNFNVGNFNGGIGVKHFLSDNMALAGQLNFATTSTSLPASPGPGEVVLMGPTP